MTTKRLAFVCVLIVALLSAGCGKVRYPKYYTLAIAPSPSPADAPGRRLGSLAVHEFATPAYLRQGRIVYRESPTQVGYYEFHRWVTDPASTVTHAVVERLRSSGPFSPVDFDRKQSKSDFLLRGQLERLDEIDYGDGVRVEVKLSAELVDSGKKSAVWSGAQTETARVAKANVNSVVIEMGQAAQRCLDRLIADMQQKVESAPPPSAGAQTPRSKL
jgi:ABC-type uncharacterized transport system auxiliary subunit